MILPPFGVAERTTFGDVGGNDWSSSIAGYNSVAGDGGNVLIAQNQIMTFDPAKPMEEAPLDAAEMRN